MDQLHRTTGTVVSLTELLRKKEETALKAVEDLGAVALRRDRFDAQLAVRRCINDRKARNKFLPEHLFADPAWDMLLALYEAQLDQVRIGTSNLGDISAVPATTALRWITTLVNEDLVERHADPLDARRIFVKLSANGLERMEAYFNLTEGPTSAGN